VIRDHDVNRWFTLGALLLALTGLGLRLYAIDWGLPFVYDPDEPDFVQRAFAMLQSGNLDPGWFGHPGSTAIYSFLAAFGALEIVGSSDLAAAAAAFREDPSPWFLAARVVIVLFATGTLVLAWQFARRIAGGAGAMLATGLLAASMLHTQLSIIARSDMVMTFFVLLAMLAVLSVATVGRWRDYLAAGFCLGLAIATKYPAAVFSLVIIGAHLLRLRDRSSPVWAEFPRLAAAGGATIAGIAVGSPYLLVSPLVVLRDLNFEARTYHLSGTSEGFLPALASYLGGPILTDIGAIGAVLAVAGAWHALTRRHRSGQLALLALAVYLAFISSLSLRWDRWALPALPFVVALAALGLSSAADALRARSGARAVSAMVLVVTAVALIQPTMASLPWTVATARDDSRDMASRWILENVPAGSAILAESYTPQLPADRYRLYTVEQGRIWRLDTQGRRFAVPRGIVGTLADPGFIARQGIDYVVIANHYDRRLAEAERYQRTIATYEAIMRSGEKVYEADQAPWVAIGLPVRIFRVR